jgi:hypothetical protein
VANAVTALAAYKSPLQPLQYECLEVLIRRAIELVESMNALTLIMVINSLTKMDIVNNTLLEKARGVVL